MDRFVQRTPRAGGSKQISFQDDSDTDDDDVESNLGKKITRLNLSFRLLMRLQFS